MTIFRVAADVVREAFAGKLVLGIFVVIVVALGALTFALDLEVVDGALAAGRIFGKATGGSIVPVDVALRPIFQAVADIAFYGGLFFGIIASADIAPRMLAPGRVELLLSLPVRRAELVIGTYFGVAFLAVCAIALAVGGVSAVLFCKSGFFTIAPAVGAACAVVGFLAIYGVMVLVSSLARSAALSAGVGFVVTIIGIATSDRHEFLSWFRSPVVRQVLAVVVAPLPRLQALGELGSSAVAGQVTASLAVTLVLSSLAFAGCSVAVACFVVGGKDY